MDLKISLKRTIGLALLCFAVMLIFVTMGLCVDDADASRVDPSLPVTSIELSGKTPIIGVRSWRICGPFVVDDQDQKYSLSTEAEMFEKDYLAAADAREAPLKLPSGITDVQINFRRDPIEEPPGATRTGVFLNQNQTFPTPDVSTQLLYWGGYHVFKVLYAAAELASASEQDVVLLAPTNSPLKIWVNDAVQTQSFPGSVGTDWDTHVGVKVHLHAGRNTILVKSLCFPLRNDFAIWVATPDAAHQFIEEHGGVSDVLTQLVIPRGAAIRPAPIVALYDELPDQPGRYEIRDVAGRIAAAGTIAAASPEIDATALPDGLYSISLQKGALATGELFFLGDIQQRLAMYSARCAAKADADLPCDALPKLTQVIESSGASFRIDKQKLMVLLLAQFEWSLHGDSLQTVFVDNAPRMRLISFRSNIDGSIQHYYLHLPPDALSGQPLPLVVIEPYNTRPLSFFDSPTTVFASTLQRYARFANRYRLSVITPFGRGQMMPAPLAEQDVLEAIQDAKARFKVDESRIYLAGDCAGGRSAYLMAEDHPEMFAAVSTTAAATGESIAATNPLANAANALLRLRNLSTIPIRLTHGEADFHSPSAQALVFMQEARKVGITPQMVWLRGDGKFGLIEPLRSMFEFFATVQRRDPAIPRHIALAVTEPEHNHAFWIDVDQMRTMDAPAYITADIKGRNHIKIAATNVQRLTVNTRKLPPAQAARHSWVVVCNRGQKQRLAPDAAGQIVLSLSGDAAGARSAP